MVYNRCARCNLCNCQVLILLPLKTILPKFIILTRISKNSWISKNLGSQKLSFLKLFKGYIDSVDNVEHVANVNNVDNVDNVENVENVENVDNVENVENVENVKNVENV